MKTLVRLFAIALSALLPLPASAAPRTFVASTGLDTNPCSLIAPLPHLRGGHGADQR